MYTGAPTISARKAEAILAQFYIGNALNLRPVASHRKKQGIFICRMGVAKDAEISYCTARIGDRPDVPSCFL